MLFKLICSLKIPFNFLKPLIVGNLNHSEQRNRQRKVCLNSYTEHKSKSNYDNYLDKIKIFIMMKVK